MSIIGIPATYTLCHELINGTQAKFVLRCDGGMIAAVENRYEAETLARHHYHLFGG